VFPCVSLSGTAGRSGPPSFSIFERAAAASRLSSARYACCAPIVTISSPTKTPIANRNVAGRILRSRSTSAAKARGERIAARAASTGTAMFTA